MTYLILIKHSLPEIVEDKPAREWVLSEEGRKRCQPLAQALTEYKPDRIVTSTELKAQETGEIIARALGLPCTTAHNLHEHERPFLASRAEFEDRIRNFFIQPKERVFGNESANEACNRFAQAIRDVIEQQPDKNVAAVAHGTVITLFVTRHNAIEPYPLWQRLDLPSFIVLSLPDFKQMALRETISN
jgi:broad specificity phosphatase PhoE